MSKSWTNAGAWLLVVCTLTGCATSSQKLLSHDGQTMDAIWWQQTAGDTGQCHLLQARLILRRPLLDKSPADDPSAYTRTAQNEIVRQFQRLPNPDLVMYVFPHLAGNDPVPVPGYSSVFPLYQRVQYALLGERVEDY